MSGSRSARAKTKRGRARGEGSIRRRKDGKYEGRVSLGCDSAGKRRQCSVYGKTRGEVLDKMHALRAQARSGIEPPKVAAASTFFEGWLESLRGRREPSTVATYERTVRLYLAPWLRRRPLTSLRPDDVEAFLQELAKRGVGQRTIAKAHATLRAALTYALKTEKVSRNVAAMIERPAYEPKRKTVFIVAQARAFLSAIDGHPAEALLGLALLTQIREGELLALRWSDVDLDAHTILVQRTMQDDETGRPQIGSAPKTRAGVRLVFFPRSPWRCWPGTASGRTAPPATLCSRRDPGSRPHAKTCSSDGSARSPTTAASAATIRMRVRPAGMRVRSVAAPRTKPEFPA
jgi:integrase